MSILSRFKNKLGKSSNFLSLNIINTFKSKKVDTDTLEELESILISSDISLDVVNKLIESVKKINSSYDDTTDAVFEILANKIEGILSLRQKNFLDVKKKEKKIILFIGVNGSGKTTTLGKIANKILFNNKLLIAACDTFRAAAVKQLENWSKKNNNDFISGEINEDPASIAYKACDKFKNESYDYLLIDTAGRLSNNINLLNQLVKLKKVIEKFDENFEIETVLVLDGTNGSNMIKQAEIFGDALNVSSIIITKLDGTAKGGALISIANKYEIPISYVGLGEKVEDLVEFDSKDFSRSILNLDN